ncbi:hypothetical protein BCR37DRAFT_132949 [Protomyces lactucae-debilis]|uniref:D-serine dehydratase n=1 Tax=Protomyces lactucae-debilis TaxID=2754530 RepID=A0A1Y2FTQ9_PROLT|nr:uncharacterized protein BCR37DRAFT_132949 [Protomyces lactucae-debilis]ORY86957.1 hypothetical protein BCR37DRAFT_132949 [Protomyces lactucae-debilis]
MTMFSAAHNPKADKAALTMAYIGKHISELPTPACLIDIDIAQQNCQDMHENVDRLNVLFRAHVKTHKTMELTRMQLTATHTNVIVSTMMEAYNLLPLVREGLIREILYGAPLAKSRFAEAFEIRKQVPHFLVMVDNIETVRQMQDFCRASVRSIDVHDNYVFEVFVKVDCGTHRAGLEPESHALRQLIDAIIKDEDIGLYGFYCHSGHSYDARTPGEAKERLFEEIASANAAAQYALSRPEHRVEDFVLSVGATPTAHVSLQIDKSQLPEIAPGCCLELHSGNYVLSDLQQFSTSLVQNDRIAIRVIADVTSTYYDKRDEYLINAGVIAFARETSAVPGFGLVVPADDKMWNFGKDTACSTVVRLSQEHGIVSPWASAESGNRERVGDRVAIIPQHACITAQGFPYLFGVRDNVVVDVMPTFHGF